MKNVVSMCVAVGLITVMSSAGFAADRWLGTWKLNVAKSKFSPGPAPRSQTVRFEAAEGGFQFTSETVDSQGQSVQGGYAAKPDGKDYPWKNNISADTVAVKRIDDYSYESTWKKAARITLLQR